MAAQEPPQCDEPAYWRAQLQLAPDCPQETKKPQGRALRLSPTLLR